jgi:hypothetical protein
MEYIDMTDHSHDFWELPENEPYIIRLSNGRLTYWIGGEQIRYCSSREEFERILKLKSFL